MSTIKLPPLPKGVSPDQGIGKAMREYAEEAVRQALEHAFNELNALFMETLKARIPGEDLDYNDEQFNIGMCAQALGISRCQHVLRGLAPHPEKDHGEST